MTRAKYRPKKGEKVTIFGCQKKFLVKNVLRGGRKNQVTHLILEGLLGPVSLSKVDFIIRNGVVTPYRRRS